MLSNITSLSPLTQDLSGKEFNRLTVLNFAGYRKGKAWWCCVCVCGVVKNYRAAFLLREDIKSCGCLQRELASKKRKTHGKTKTVEYRVWYHMIARCHTRTDKAYHNYGGRGITVCDAWRKSFETFLSDMGPRPGKAYSIERKDNNGPYSKENCIWTTKKEQQRNRRNNFFLTYKGETLCLTSWAERLRMHKTTISARKRRGDTDEEALSRPVRHR